MALLDDIAGLVAGGLKSAGMTKPAVLIKYTKGTRTPDHLGEGTNDTANSYAAEGIVQRSRRDKIGTTLVEKSDRVVRLFGATIAGGQTPTTKDRITIDGFTSVVIDVEWDAANATYLCLTRS